MDRLLPRADSTRGVHPPLAAGDVARFALIAVGKVEWRDAIEASSQSPALGDTGA
nr:hypothetical protein [uncultured Roseateles sp.]